MRRPRLLRAILVPLLLVLYGALGLILIIILVGILASGVRGGDVVASVARLSIAALVFMVWLYSWRRFTLWVRDSACRARV
ncbi:membrane-flanked domain protein [Pyrolobus fumarii 1A]|uniref:Membrane-flanked domain protein n=1 Tax=Pyrolobus fumarii (strain DSM 11204 / 1A) TaxID=694429 RepID=G0EGD8_PYRF1|nr:hypothetical protein [Pyrolobus fumarii]AEM39163.1 membrane-flanked domain protein [Pyrolobus fumarii 1A]